MSRNSLFVGLIILALVTLCPSTPAWSQQSGAVSFGDAADIKMSAPANLVAGTVLTADLAIAGEVTITLTNLDTGQSESISTGSDGASISMEIVFDSLGLPPGSYLIEEIFVGTVVGTSPFISFDPLELSAEFDSWETYIPNGATITLNASASGSGSIDGDLTGGTGFLDPIPANIWALPITLQKDVKGPPKPDIIEFSLSFDATLNKDTFIILPENEPPVLAGVTIGVKVDDTFDPAATAYTDSVLGVVSIDATDDFTPADSLKKIYKWLKNGTEISGATGATLDGADFNKDDTISLELVVEDSGGLQSSSVVSNDITIADSPPSKPEVVIVARGAPAGTPLTRENDLFCQIITESIDPDAGDVVTYNYEWSKDGVVQPALADAVVSKELFQKNQVWKCTVTPVSAGVEGEMAEAEGAIENAPVKIDEIGDKTVTETFTLDFTLPIVDADGDGDINKPTFAINPVPEEAPEIVLGSYKFVWTPSRNDSDDETGSKVYEITITVSDIDGATAETTFIVTVNNLNRPVVIEVTGNTASTGAGDPINLTVTVTDDDPSPPSLWTYSVSAEVISPAGAPLGSLTAAINDFNNKAEAEDTDQKERTFSWTPNRGDEGKNFRLRFTVKDNGTPAPSADQETVAISVAANQAPTLSVTKDGEPVGDAPIFIKENESLTLNLTGTDPDVADIVSLSAVSVLIDDGIATFAATDGNPATGTFTLSGSDETPIPPGLYSAAFTATDEPSNPDNPLTDSRTVIINVEDVNESPEFLSTPVTQEVNETETVSFTVEAQDNDGDVLTISAQAVDADGYPVDLPASSQLSSLNFDPVTEVYSRTFTWTPGYDVTKEGRTITAARIVFTADDGRGEDNSTSEQTWVIRVTDKNRAPVILEIADVTPINEGETLSVTVTVKDDDKELVTISSTDLPGGDSFTLGASSFDSDTGITTQEMTWTAPFDVATAADPVVSQAVTITADDGNPENNTDSEDINVVVNNVNRPVELTISSNSPIDEGDEMQVTVEGADPDVEDKISLELIGFPGTKIDFDSHSGSHIFTWTPGYDVVTGTATSIDIELTVKGDDNNDLPNSVVTEFYTVTVNDKNDPPVLPETLSATVEEGQILIIGPTGAPVPEDAIFAAIDVTGNADNDPLDYSVTDAPSGLTLAGAIASWQPGYDQSGVYVFNYNATDVRLDAEGNPKTGGAAPQTATTEVTVEVTEANRPPKLDAVGNLAFVAGQPNTHTFTASDPDPGDNLFYSSPNLPAGATLNETTGELNWTPINPDDIGEHDVTVEVRDRADPADPDVLTDSESFTIAVGIAEDQPPVISNIAVSSDDSNPDGVAGQIDETETAIVTFDVNDPDGDPITPSAALLTSGGAVTVTPITDDEDNVIGARVEWLTDFGDAGDHKLELKAASTGVSGVELSDTEIVGFTVNKFNRLPQVSDVAISPDPPTGADNLTVSYTFSDEDGDVENGTEIRWYKGAAEEPGRGDEVTTLRNARVVSSALTAPGDKWTVTVNPSDDGGKTFGYESGAEPSDTIVISDTPPEFKSASVSPSEGIVATEFEYSVIYEDKDNQAPDSVVVNIASPEITLPMIKDSADSDFTDGVEYTATISGLKKLPEGENHTYTFVATYDSSEITSGPHVGPTIEDSPAVVSSVTTSGNTGDIAISYNLTDLDGERANIRLDYSDSGGLIWVQNAVSKNNVAPGAGLSLIWSSPAGVDKKSYLVRVVPNGEIENAGISSSFVIDNREPDAPTISSIGGRAVTDGAIDGGNVFGPSFSVVGAGEANAEARGYGSATFTAPIDASGNFSIAFSGLSDGEHTINVTVFDGIHESEPTSLQIIVDTVPPTIEVISPTDGTEVSNRTPTFKARVEDVGSGLESHTVSIAKTTYTMAYNIADKTASYTLPQEAALGQGVSYTTVFEATDKAGLITRATVNFTVNIGAADKIPPVIGNLTPTGFVTTTEFSISARVVDSESGVNNESGYGVKIKKMKSADGTDVSATTPENTLSATISPVSASESIISAPVTEGDLTSTSTVSGEYRITVEAADKATPEPNKAQAIWTIMVDVDAPDPISFDPSIPTLTNQSTIPIMGTAEPNSTVSISVNSGAPIETTADGITGDFTVSSVSLSREGRNTISGTATDAAGNSSPATTLNIIRDTVPPLIFDPNPASGAVISDAQPTIYLTIIDAYGINEDSIQFSFDGNPVSFTYDSDSGQLSYQTEEPFTETGTHTFSASVEDMAGNQSAEFSSSFLYQVGLEDTMPPVISNFHSTGIDTVSATVSDNIEVADITIQATGPAGTAEIPHGAALPASSVDLEFSFNVPELQDGGELPDGEYNITIYAEDGAGNYDQRTLAVEKDTTTPAPSLSYALGSGDVVGDDGRIYTSNSQILVQGSDVEAGALVTVYKNDIPYGTAVASSAIEMSVALTLGANEIKAKAEDIKGNESEDSNILNVTLDLTPPSISGPSIVNSAGDVTGKATNDGAITVNFTVVEAQDETNVGVEQTSLTIKQDGIPLSTIPNPVTPVELNLSADGEYTFIVEAEDALGNESSAQAEVILDTEEPTVTINTPSGDTTASTFPNITATIDGFDLDISSIEMWLSSGKETEEAANTTADGDVVTHVFIATAGGGSVSYIPSVELEDGKYYRVEVVVFDLAGNQALASKIFQVVAGDDEIGPIITQLIPPPDGTISSDELQAIAFFLADEFSGVDPATVLIEINGYFYTLEELLGEAEIATFRETGLVVIHFRNLRLLQRRPALGPLDLSQLERPTSLSSGKNTVRVQVADKVGNISEVQWSFSVVTEKPKTPILQDIVSPISETAITVEGTVPDVVVTNPVSVVVTVDGAIVGKGLVNPDNGSFIVEDVSLSAGANSIRAYAIDSVGNQSKLTSPVEVTVDSVPPVVTIEPLPEVTNQSQITVQAAISDNTSYPISAVNIVLNGETESATPTAKLEIPVTLQSGSNTIVIEAFDAAGNRGVSDEVTIELDTIGLGVAPENLVAQVDITGENIKLTWREVEGAYAYNVYRSEAGAVPPFTKGGSGGILDATELSPIIRNVTATSTLDETAIPSVTYFYAVTALDAAGNENKQLVSNSPNATLIIGTNGGQAVLPDGTKAALKANGMADNVLLSGSVAINVLDDSAVPALKRAVPDSVREFIITMQDGSVIDKFKQTVRITIPYPEQVEDTPQAPQIFVLTEDDSWTKIEDQRTDIEANIVTATVQNFGIYRLAISLPPWDVNGDERVDILDLMLVSEHFGEINPEIGDVDGDGNVDISDLALVGVHLGEVYTQ
ncbi:TPA: hypothetical protein EYP66_03255 [Candidatus Poribacteria bacterium]|nr:hypothetical protein [Candidatus Poribacteria bacterium]